MQREATLASRTDVTSGHQGASPTGGDTLVVNIYPSATVRGYLTEIVCIIEGFGRDDSNCETSGYRHTRLTQLY